MSAVKTIEEIAEETPIRQSLPQDRLDDLMKNAIVLGREHYPKINDTAILDSRATNLELAEKTIKSRQLDCLKQRFEDKQAYVDAVTCGIAYSILMRHHLDLFEATEPYRFADKYKQRSRLGLYFHACLHNFNEPFRLRLEKKGYHEESHPQAVTGVDIWNQIYPDQDLHASWYGLAAELHFRLHRLGKKHGYDLLDTSYDLLEEADKLLDSNSQDVDAIESAARNMYFWANDRRMNSKLCEFADNLKYIIEKIHRFPPTKRSRWAPLPVAK